MLMVCDFYRCVLRSVERCCIAPRYRKKLFRLRQCTCDSTSQSMQCWWYSTTAVVKLWFGGNTNAMQCNADGLWILPLCPASCWTMPPPPPRYREILFDFSTEFKKTSAALQRKREATELFKSSRYRICWVLKYESVSCHEYFIREVDISSIFFGMFSALCACIYMYTCIIRVYVRVCARMLYGVCVYACDVCNIACDPERCGVSRGCYAL